MPYTPEHLTEEQVKAAYAQVIAQVEGSALAARLQALVSGTADAARQAEEAAAETREAVKRLRRDRDDCLRSMKPVSLEEHRREMMRMLAACPSEENGRVPASVGGDDATAS